MDQVDGSANPALPASPTPSSSDNNTTWRVQAIAATPDPPPNTLDEIRAAQAADDNLLPVIQALLEQKQPASADLRQYPEEARVLFPQWDSLVLQDGTLYRKFHYPDGTVNFLQIILPTKLRRPFIERLHSELGHFGRTKTALPCLAVPIFPVGAHIQDYWYATVQFATCTSGVARHPAKRHLSPCRSFVRWLCCMLT